MLCTDMAGNCFEVILCTVLYAANGLKTVRNTVLTADMICTALTSSMSCKLFFNKKLIELF